MSKGLLGGLWSCTEIFRKNLSKTEETLENQFKILARYQYEYL